MTRSVFLQFVIASCMLVGCAPQAQKTHDVIVIGGGLMGSSAGWHAANNGASVIVLEMQDSVYHQGSSFGEARIARSNNRGNDIWSYLHNRSVKETQLLVEYLNQSAPDRTYSITDIYTTAPVTYVGRSTIYDQLLASLIRQKVNYDMAVNPQEGKRKYNVKLPDSVLIQREYNLHSGTLNPKALIQLLHTAIRRKGSAIRYNNKVTAVQYDTLSNTYDVTTINQKTNETNILKAHQIVSAAGPYTGTLLQDIAPYFDQLIDPQRVFLAFFKIQDSTYANLTDQDIKKVKSFYPVINSAQGTRDGSFFSMIEYYDQNNHPIIKIGGHFQRSTIDDLDKVWEKSLSKEEIQWSLNSTSNYMDLLDLPIKKNDLQLVDGYSCVYSLTQSEVPLVTPIKTNTGEPNHDFIVMGGMSGEGAKGAMTYGHMAARLLKGPIPTTEDTLYQITAESLGFHRIHPKDE